MIDIVLSSSCSPFPALMTHFTMIPFTDKEVTGAINKGAIATTKAPSDLTILIILSKSSFKMIEVNPFPFLMTLAPAPVPQVFLSKLSTTEFL